MHARERAALQIRYKRMAAGTLLALILAVALGCVPKTPAVPTPVAYATPTSGAVAPTSAPTQGETGEEPLAARVDGAPILLRDYQKQVAEWEAAFIGQSAQLDDESKQALETVVKEMEADLNKISKPIPIPTFSTIIKDSDGNILFFEYPKEENANLFNVWIYEDGGKFICKSSFVCNDYELQIMPSKMVLHDGYLYALQLRKDAAGVPFDGIQRDDELFGDVLVGEALADEMQDVEFAGRKRIGEWLSVWMWECG